MTLSNPWEEHMEDVMAMSHKERERLKVIDCISKKTLTQELGAKMLGISIRQIQRLLKVYNIDGDRALISKKRGQRSNNHLPENVKMEALHLIRSYYPDFGPTFAQEKLTDAHNLKLSVSSVRGLMITHKIWLPNRLTTEKVHKCRERRECFGELIQMDGSYHAWFEERGSKCCLLVLIDDATSRLLALKFVPWESVFAYFDLLKGYLKIFGRPLSLYTDRHAIFETTRKNEKSYKETQFNRATNELSIKLILALSSQAKGRVERVNQTLQDRLVKEMRLANISTIEEGNAFLASYLEKHNAKFAKKPKSPIDAHRELGLDYNLEQILCLHHERKITKDLMIYWNGGCYQITDANYHKRLGKKKVQVFEKEDGEVKFYYHGQLLNVVNFDKQPAISQENNDKFIILNHWNKPRGGHPGKNHPWKIKGKEYLKRQFSYS